MPPDRFALFYTHLNTSLPPHTAHTPSPTQPPAPHQVGDQAPPRARPGPDPTHPSPHTHTHKHSHKDTHTHRHTHTRARPAPHQVAIKRLHALDAPGAPPPGTSAASSGGASVAAFGQFFDREIAILASIRHPNVVNFIGG